MRRFGVLLFIVLFGALLLRVIGINWDDYTHLHPDERFVTTITGRIGDPASLTDEARGRCPDDSNVFDYFNTSCSVWNPNNVNPGSFVYGTLPVFMVHGVSQVVADLNPFGLNDPQNWTEYDYVHLVGRVLNALADVVTTFFVFLIGWRLFSRWHGLLAAALYACAALAIQLAHFWTVDIIANMFFVIGLYAAVEVGKTGRFWAVLLFGLALGAATASRINLAPMAVLLPVAMVIRLQQDSGWLREWRSWLVPSIFGLLVAASLSLLVFRVAQPYAFEGPHFADWALNEKWLDDNEYVSSLSRAPSDGWPPSVQWFERLSYVYPWFNMVAYGMGLFFGLAATFALVGAVVNQLRKWEISPAVGLLTLWVIFYFALVGGIHQMTMRYYLPLYPPLALLAVWGMLALPGRARRYVTGVVVGATALWALAFVTIYTQPVTRIEASQWLWENAPATVTFTDEEGNLHPASIDGNRWDALLHTAFQGESYLGETFNVNGTGELNRFQMQFTDAIPATVTLQLYRVNPDNSLQTVIITGLETDDQGRIIYEPPIPPVFQAGQYRWHIQNEWEAPQEYRYFIAEADWTMNGAPFNQSIEFASPYEPLRYLEIDPIKPLSVRLLDDIRATSILIPHMLGEINQIGVRVGDLIIPAGLVETDSTDSALGPQRRFQLAQPLELAAGTPIELVTNSGGAVHITGTALATEGAWDDGLPIAFCDYGDSDRPWYQPIRLRQDCERHNRYSLGHYTELPLNMAETDSDRKRLRMVDILTKADYLTISSNRFYDAQPRVPRRFGMSIEYYERLFNDELGYTLSESFVRNPRLLFIELQDQVLPTQDAPDWLNEWESEEAFTVYDRPTVFIFDNTGFETSLFPTELPSPDDTPADTRNQITLDTLPQPTFTVESTPITNGDVVFDLAVWVIGVVVVGWLSFPLMFVIFPNMPLRGFVIGRGVLWILLAFVAWLLTTFLGSFFWSRVGLWLLLLAYIGLNGWLAYRYRIALVSYLRTHWRMLLAVEVLFVVALWFGLIMRMVNPDLWHVTRGGEKPMDLAYFNAVLRASVFPPPNPWLAGYEINYYYFGFVFAALPVKMGGFAPEVGYHLTLGTLYAVVFMNVFTLAYAVIPTVRKVLRAGLAFTGALFVMVAGNLGTLHLLLFPEPNMHPNRWYWYPTRILGESANGGGGAIHEIPIFSFLWGDLHPHVLALLPVTLFLLTGWLMIRSKKLWLGVPLGALAAIIFMSNSWDVILYVPLGALAMWLASQNSLRRFVQFGIVVGLSGILSIAPYYLNFTLGENSSIEIWDGARSLIEPFLLVWGIPFGIVSLWMLSRLKAALIPDEAARKRPYEFGAAATVAIVLFFLPGELATTVLMVVMILLAGALFFLDAPERRLLYLAIAGMIGVILGVEYFAFSFDVNRMNTVFKIAFQVWLWFGILIPVIFYYMVRQRMWAQLGLSILLIGLGLLFPVQAIPARFEDNETQTITLDGRRFMNEMVLTRDGVTVNTVNDMQLIDYMRENLDGYPTIAEWYEREYWWNSRVAVQTGFPAVVGWRNHMRQQYTHLHDEIERRINDMQAIYQSGSGDRVRQVIEDYTIDYIVFGELERGHAAENAEVVFSQMVADGELRIAYEGDSTTLYEVVRPDEELVSAGG